MKKIIMPFIVLGFLAAACFGDVIYLKDGKSIQGDIVKKDSDSVTVRTPDTGREFVFTNDEIAEILPEIHEAPQPKPAPPAPQGAENIVCIGSMYFPLGEFAISYKRALNNEVGITASFRYVNRSQKNEYDTTDTFDGIGLGFDLDFYPFKKGLDGIYFGSGISVLNAKHIYYDVQSYVLTRNIRQPFYIWGDTHIGYTLVLGNSPGFVLDILAGAMFLPTTSFRGQVMAGCQF